MSILPASAAALNGFRANASGLLVPESLSRVREVWTRDEWRLIDRVSKLLERRGVDLILACPACARAGKPRIDQDREGDRQVLRCACKDRVFTKAF